MQLGFSVYLQLILILLSKEYKAHTLDLALFNCSIGLGFAISMLFVMKRLAKRFGAGKIAILGLFVTGVLQISTSLLKAEAMQWALSIPIGAADMIAFTAILTCCSLVVDKESKGLHWGFQEA